MAPERAGLGSIQALKLWSAAMPVPIEDCCGWGVLGGTGLYEAWIKGASEVLDSCVLFV